MEGAAERVDASTAKQGYLDLVNAKYGTDYQLVCLDSATTAVYRVRPL